MSTGTLASHIRYFIFLELIDANIPSYRYLIVLNVVENKSS